MRNFVWGFIIGLILIPVAAAVYFGGGFAPAAVNDPPFPLEQLVAGTALHAKISRNAPKRELSSFTTPNIVDGADVYRHHCVGCHGLPDMQRNRPEPKMYPPPPQLFTPDGYVTDDPVGVTFWKVKNGIRMTGMPSFQNVLTDQQRWDVAALLATADKLPPEALQTLKQPLFPPPPPSSAKPTAPSGAKPKVHHPAS
ncbi:MAG: cytochrome c [Acidobacteriota bacterium]|nr:cytochrome c [Acidobacteriota bacterium]MDE3171261.1 cytochrome c [Acidobacteriota bacterium]